MKPLKASTTTMLLWMVGWWCPGLPTLEAFVAPPALSSSYHSSLPSLPCRSIDGSPMPVSWTRGYSVSPQQQQQQDQEEESLSDVDARVLQDMLAESKLDLRTEADIRKLLERGTVKSTVNPKVAAAAEQRERAAASAFDSTLLQTLTDTVLWKKLSAQTSDWVESAKIWVTNKVEQDLQVAAALGLFAWERAVKDVARALPATASTVTPKTLFQLTNQSSYDDNMAEKERLRRDLNRPSDEIQQVTRAIRGILQGDTPAAASNARGLRTAAAAGTARMADRQRQAFRQRRRLDRKNRDLTRWAGAAVDATYELRQELQAETSTAGYKTKPLRQALQAGTAGVLSAVQESARLAAAKRQESRRLLQQQDQPAVVDRSVLYTQLVEERSAVLARLSVCIDSPLDSWLSNPSEELARETLGMTEDSLREVATLLVVVRNEMAAVETTSSFALPEGATVGLSDVQEQLTVLRSDVAALEELRTRVSIDVSTTVADALYSFIVGLVPATAEGTDTLSSSLPLLLRLDQVEESLQEAPPPSSNVPYAEPAVEEETTRNAFFASAASVEQAPPIPATNAAIDNDATYTETSFVVDVEPEHVFKTTDVAAEDLLDDDEAMASSVEGVSKYETFLAEVVSDDDVATAFGEAKSVENLSEEQVAAEEVQEEPNFAVKAVLRVLDVAFFVLEKSFTTVLPAAFRYSVNAKIRLEEIQRNGQGQKGWEFLRRSADAKGRY